MPYYLCSKCKCESASKQNENSPIYNILLLRIVKINLNNSHQVIFACSTFQFSNRSICLDFDLPENWCKLAGTRNNEIEIKIAGVASLICFESMNE